MMAHVLRLHLLLVLGHYAAVRLEGHGGQSFSQKFEGLGSSRGYCPGADELHAVSPIICRHRHHRQGRQAKKSTFSIRAHQDGHLKLVTVLWGCLPTLGWDVKGNIFDQRFIGVTTRPGGCRLAHHTHQLQPVSISSCMLGVLR